MENLGKVQYESLYGKPYELDAVDKALLAKYTAVWTAYRDGPRVGEYLKTSVGYLRFTHNWGDTIQTTVRPGYDSSFYLSRGECMIFSGSLDQAIPKASLDLTTEVRNGSCWFFSHEYVTAHNGVYVEVPCRVWRLV